MNQDNQADIFASTSRYIKIVQNLVEKYDTMDRNRVEESILEKHKVDLNQLNAEFDKDQNAFFAKYEAVIAEWKENEAARMLEEQEKPRS